MLKYVKIGERDGRREGGEERVMYIEKTSLFVHQRKVIKRVTDSRREAMANRV